MIKALSEDDLSEIYSLIKQGWSTEKLAEKYGYSKSRMARILKNAAPSKESGCVNCTKEVCKKCYYGNMQGTMCNYLLVEGHSRTIDKVYTNDEGQRVAIYKNPTYACGAFIFSIRKAIEQNKIDVY